MEFKLIVSFVILKFICQAQYDNVQLVMNLINGCDEVKSEKDFYRNAEEYWKTIPANLNGMLGGYERISNIDIKTSQLFIKEYLKGKNPRLKKRTALDCGAGIGRVSKYLLLPLFQSVDLVEVNRAFLDKAKTYLGSDALRVGNFFCCGLQDLEFNERKYDLIWIQWVTGHLTDDHFVAFLKRCKAALHPGGLIIIKDNVLLSGVVLDEEDSSVTRNGDDLKAIYRASGLHVIKQEKQSQFPAELYKVLMTALE